MNHKITDEKARLVGNILNVRWNKVDFQEFKKGIEVELEHGSDFPETDIIQDDLVNSGKIALAHLRELPDYYSRLDNMETDTKKSEGLKENDMVSGAAPVNMNSFSEGFASKVAQALNLDIEKVQPDEFRLGMVKELDDMEVHTTAGLTNEKLAKAAMTAYENILAQPAFYSNPQNQQFSHPLSNDRNRFAVPGSEVLAMEELEECVDLMITESLADIVAKVKTAAGNTWEAAKQKLSKASGVFKKALTALSNKLQQAQTKIAPFVSAIAQAQKEAGEKLPVNQTMKIAMGLPGLAQQAQAEIGQQSQQAQKVAQQKAAEQPQPQQQAQQEALMIDMAVMLESAAKKYEIAAAPKQTLAEGRQLLTEVLTPMVILGFALAIVGGVPMLLAALHKLAKKFGMEKTAHAIHAAHHVAHTIEEKVVDYVIPDKLSYKVYQKFWDNGWQLRENHEQDENGNPIQLTFEQYRAGEAGARKKIEEIVYRVILVFFFVKGAGGAIKAGFSLLGAAETAATTVKGVEIAGAVAQVAELVTDFSGDLEET